MVAEVFAETGLVVTMNVAVVAFAATATLAGTCAAEVLLLDSMMTTPPAGAGPFNRIAPIAESPPPTDVGVKVTDCRIGSTDTPNVIARVAM